MHEILNQTPADAHNYPLNGGVRPSSPGFPAEMNPEIQRLQKELAEKTNSMKLLETNLRVLEARLDVTEQQLREYREIIFALIGKSATNSL
jgi:hypothetical protein